MNGLMAVKAKLGEGAISALAARAAGDPRALARVAAVAARSGYTRRAYAIAREARTLAADDPEIRSLTEAAVSGLVPSWHFKIVRDEVRNAAYDEALRRSVSPTTRVLDIGAGSGLLSMMAARAGAEVIGCEMNPAVADAAREVIAANGLSDRVGIVPKRSQELDREVDLDGPVDLVVQEIVSNDLLRQSVLPVMEDAVRRLLKPGGRVIPASGTIRVALAWWSDLASRRVAAAGGFDLSAFNRLIQVPHHLKSDDPALTLSSDPADLFTFDFNSGGPFPPDRAEIELKAKGRSNGIVQWIELGLDEVTSYENEPGRGFESCWACLFHPLDKPASTGDTVRIAGDHDRLNLRIWPMAGSAIAPGECGDG